MISNLTASGVLPRISRSLALGFLVSLLQVAAVQAAVWPVRSAAEIRAVSRQASAGDVLEMADGDWADQTIQFEGIGREDAPITLRARNPGKVVLIGSSRIEVQGRWLVVDGLRFERGGLHKGEAVVRIGGRKGQPASDCRLTNSSIVAYNPVDPQVRYPWVELAGTHHRVDHNLFQGQNHSGPTIIIQRNSAAPDRDVIERNHFVDRAPGQGNGYETIRIGTSENADSDSLTVVQFNLFERTNGEVEAISIKAGGNEIRSNTFVAVAGTVSLRHGSGNTVRDNFFNGLGMAGTGGVRIAGSGHLVTGNQFQDLDGRLGGVVILHCGDVTHRPAGYEPANNATVSGNVFARVKSPAIRIGAECDRPPQSRLPVGVEIRDNVFFDVSLPLNGTNATSENVRLFGNETNSAVPTAPGISHVDMQAQASESGLLRVVPQSTASHLGQRPQGQGPLALTAAEVGPAWTRSASGSGK